MLNKRQIKERINKLKEEIRILSEIVDGKSDKRFGRPIGSYEYPDEQIEFLKKNKEVPMNDLLEMFNKEFGTSFSKGDRAIYNFMERIGFIIPKFRKKEYLPKRPMTIDKQKKTREKKILEDLKINEVKEDV